VVADGGRDVDGVEGFNGASLEDGVQCSGHKQLHVAITTY